MLSRTGGVACGPRRECRSRASMRGVGLIEVMVSVLVLAVGLLGVAAMQSVALRGGQSSLESTQAVIQTNAILEAMRVNRATADGFNTGGMLCEAPAVGHAVVQVWIGDLKNSIGTDGDESTCAEIAGCPDACVITVRWDDSRAGGQGGRELVTAAQL